MARHRDSSFEVSGQFVTPVGGLNLSLDQRRPAEAQNHAVNLFWAQGSWRQGPFFLLGTKMGTCSLFKVTGAG